MYLHGEISKYPEPRYGKYLLDGVEHTGEIKPHAIIYKELFDIFYGSNLSDFEPYKLVENKWVIARTYLPDISDDVTEEDRCMFSVYSEEHFSTEEEAQLALESGNWTRITYLNEAVVEMIQDPLIIEYSSHSNKWWISAKIKYQSGNDDTLSLLGGFDSEQQAKEHLANLINSVEHNLSLRQETK